MGTDVLRMADRRNAASTDRFIATMADRTRGTTYADPQRAFNAFTNLTGKKLDLARSRVQEAKAFVQKTKERLATGELNELTAYGETVSAEVAVSLFEALEKMYDKAVEADDVHKLRFIGIAAHTLYAHLSREEVLVERKYPLGSEAVRSVVGKRVEEAQTIHTDVVNSLAETHLELGVKIPEQPTLTFH